MGETLNVPWAPQVGNFFILNINAGPGIGKFDNVKTTKANRVLNVGSLDTNVPPSRKYRNSQKFKLSSCNKMKEQKEFNKPLFLLIILYV